jgi:hypothetical protein
VWSGDEDGPCGATRRADATSPRGEVKDKATGEGSLDTFVALTNTTSAPLNVFIILRDGDGALLPGSPVARTIPANGTISFVVSNLILTP